MLTLSDKMWEIPVSQRFWIMRTGFLPCNSNWRIVTVLRKLVEAERRYQSMGDPEEVLRIVRARECLEGYLK